MCHTWTQRSILGLFTGGVCVCVGECVLTDVQLVLYMHSIGCMGVCCMVTCDMLFSDAALFCPPRMKEREPSAPPQQSWITKPASRSYAQHMLHRVRLPFGEKKILSNNKNVKQMFVKCRYNDFTCKYLYAQVPSCLHLWGT